jgi:multicomponent Na+:H+ antiporter subunit D
MILGALAIPLLRGRWRSAWALLLPVLSLAHLLWLHPAGTVWETRLFDFELTPIRVDKLSLVWGYVFHIAALTGVLYALHVKSAVETTCAVAYAGAAIAGVFAGDLISLFVAWELTAVFSVFLIWASRGERAYRAGMRYLLMQVLSGVLLLAGAVCLLADTGSLDFGGVDRVGVLRGAGWGPLLILLAFGIKAAFPLLHCWLPDAYPEATASGTVFLSAFTTKLAVYALARGFAGNPSLIWIGAVMAVFPLVYAVLENDLRRVLTHVLNNQLGFMVLAIGLGTPLAINGAAAQAFAHVLYKGLLFMALGAVLLRTGTAQASQLGGLSRSMPWTAGLCLLGGCSFLPPLCGFVTKSLVFAAVGEAHLAWAWLVLLGASAGAFLTASVKVPYFAFFGPDRGLRVPEAPANMLGAMGITGLLCVLVGLFPAALHRILPFALPYHTPYTASHVITHVQLFLLTTLAFAGLLRTGWFPRMVPAVWLDVDWIYRRATPAIATWLRDRGDVAWQRGAGVVERSWQAVCGWLDWLHGSKGFLGQTWSSGGMALSAAILLAIYLLLYFG